MIVKSPNVLPSPTQNSGLVYKQLNSTRMLWGFLFTSSQRGMESACSQWMQPGQWWPTVVCLWLWAWLVGLSSWKRSFWFILTVTLILPSRVFPLTMEINSTSWQVQWRTYCLVCTMRSHQWGEVFRQTWKEQSLGKDEEKFYVQVSNLRG